MTKRENIIRAYDRAAEHLFSDKTSFTEYLDFSGRFYKMPSSQVIMLFDDNPNATMVADYETWQRFGRKIKVGGWSTDVLSGGEIKRLFDISMTKGENIPYQWTLNKKIAEEFVNRLSKAENRNFTGMSDCIYHLAVNSVMERIEDIKGSLDIIDINVNDEATFRKSFASMVRRVVAARCEWNSDFTYGGTGAAKGVDLSALDLLDNSGDMETLLEEVQITAKNVLKSMEKSINDIIFERSIDNERNERVDRARDNDIGRGGSPSVVRGGEAVPAVDNDAQREDVQAERGDIRVRGDDGAVSDERGAGTDERADKPLGQGVADVYDGELSGRYSEAAGQNVVGTDSAQNRPGSVGDHRENAGGISDDEPAPDVGERDSLGGAAESVDARTDIGKSGERSEDSSVTPNDGKNTLTAESSSAVNYLSLKIAELSDAFAQKYDGDYREFTLANYAFNYALTHTDMGYDLLEYDLNLSVRDNAANMLNNGQHSYLKEYLNTIFKEAFEGRVIVDEGVAAGELLSRLSRLNTKIKAAHSNSDEGEQIRLFSEPLTQKQQAELEKLTAELTDEFTRWEKVFLDGGSDAYYEDGISLELIRNHIIYDRHELEEKFPDNLPEIYHRETPPEYPNNYQSVKKGDTLRFEYGDFLVLNIEKTNEYTGEYSVQLQDDNGEVITQNLRDIKTKFRNLTNRGEVPSRADVPDITNIPSDLDKFYVDKENERVTWVYYNPDSDAGGQLVYNRFTFDDIFDAIPKNDVPDYLESVSRQEAVDITAPNYEASAREFLKNTEDFSSLDNAYLDKLAALTEPYCYIFQLKNEEKSRDYRFAGMSELHERGLYVDRENYARVYRERIQNNETLDDIFTKFNINIPADFRGHSLSVGDVIGVRRDGKPTAYYVDSAGFTEVPDWTLSREERKARRTLTDNLVLIAENQLASDEMDTLGDKLFDYENAPHYKGNVSDWLIGNGTTADKFEEITTRYHNGEDIRAELAKGMYTDNGELGVIEFFDDKDGIGYVNIETSHDESGMTFKTKGGFEITYSWEQLGDAMITAARKEFDRHEALNKAYREDCEKYGNLYLALRDGRTIYLNRADDSEQRHTNYRLESGEEHTIGSGAKYHSTLFVADNENGERVQLNDFGVGNYSTIIHSLLESDVRGRFEVSSVEREPVFRVEKDDTLDDEAQLKAYIKSNVELLTSEILYVGSTADCEKYAEWLRLGENSQAEIKGIYRAKLDEEHTVSENVSQGDFSRLVKDEDTIFDWSKYVAIGAHSAYNRIIREKNVAIDTNVKISLSPKAEDLSDSTLELGISPFAQGNELYYTIRYNLRNEKTDEITEVNAICVDTDGVMIAGHWDHLPDYETFRAMVEADAAKAVEKIRELTQRQTITVSPDDLRVGDFVRGYGAIWKITDIDGDFSIAFENTDKNDIRSVQSIIGHWKENFVKQGYEYVSSAELSLDELREIEHSASTKKNAPKTSKTVEKLPDDYGEQPNLFGEVEREIDTVEKTIINGVDIEQALNDDIISSGTMFRDGKFRIEEYYRANKDDTKGFAKFIAKEYGTGGHTVGGFGGKLRAVNYDKKGLEIVIGLENGENTKVNWSWKKIADRIAALIDKQEYITQEDIDKRIKNARYEYDRYEKGTEEHECAEKILDMYGELLDGDKLEFIGSERLTTEEMMAGDISYNKRKVITAERIEDFYEFYGETAKELSKKFNLTLVSRDGKPMVGVPAYSFGDFCDELYDKGYIVENWQHYQEVIKPQVEENPSLVRAETLINEFCEREYNSEGDFTNRLRVGLAYTDDEETGYPIEVYADLKYNRIMTEFNKVLVSEEQYRSLDEMCDLALEHLDFDDLVYLPEKQRIKGISKTMDDADRKDADILDNYGLLHEKEPTVTLMSDENEIPDNRVERGEDNFSVSQKYIFDNERSPAAIKDFALSTGAVVSDISTKSLKNGLYGVRVETWESRADEIKDFAAAHNAVETLEWGVHQVVTFNYESGADEKYNYRSLSEAVEAANGYVKGTKQETYGEFVKYDGATVLNKENLKIEHTVGEIDVRSIFSEEVLKANGIEIPNNKMKTEVEEKPVEKENVKREQTNETEEQRIKGISKTMDDAESQEPKYTVEQTSDAFEEPFIIRNNDVSEDSPDRYYDIDGIYQTFETEKAAQEYADKLNSTVDPVIDIISNFRARTDEYYNKLGGYSAHNVEELAKYFIRAAIRENGLDAEVGEVVLYGSRCRGMEHNGSDLDFVAEIYSDMKEDALFNILHETPFEIGGAAVDINPIRAEETGSLEDYLLGAERYLQQKGAKEKTVPEVQDYRIDETEPTSFGPKARYAANIAAIKTLNRIESENRIATPDEQEILAQYVGWGGIPQAFDSDNTAWAAEYAELKELLTPDEYEAARSTVLTAHYTSPTIISAVYSALEKFGFKGGNVLEPAIGIGNFFGVMPEEIRSQSQMHGVELDDISGRIAKQLYPNADIQICGYENTAFSDNFFDAAVGNIPFGNYSVSDTKYNRENFLIHDYFFAKTLDKVAPGGVVAFITSKGTLDKTTPKVREYLAKRADLIGAIRLPNNAFKANAGTEVTADIIFLQKREKMSVEKPDWCYTAEIAEGISVNQYFVDHPEMILGEMRLVSGRYGEETACVPIEGANLKEQLDGAVMRLRRDIITARREEKRNEKHGIIPATADVRNFTFTEVDNKIYFRENNIMREIPFSKRNHERMRGMIGIRNTFRELVDAQAEGCPDETLNGLQTRLNAEYDAFVLNFGHISDIENRKVFAVDDDYNTLCGGLEIINPETKEVTKADVFTKRTIKPYVEVTHVDTPQEALFVSLDMRGFADINYMAELCGTPNEDVIKELTEGGFIYKNPETEKYEEAAEYLSGYVRDKLRKAQDAAAENPEYERNVAALEKALPPKLGAGDISVRLGASWISTEDYCNFFREYAQGVLSVGSYLARDTVLYRSVSGEYKIENKNADRSVAALSSFGTKRMNSYAIFENLLNNRDIAVYDSFDLPDGKKKRVMNKDETQLAQEKARQMREAFPKWLWSDPERREKYVEIYNELFNSLVGREYDGSHQTFPGMNPFIELTEHQKNAVMRCKLGGNTLLAHCVGAGKTFEMAAAVMEKRRLGLINKACIVVPKHLVGQMSAEWLRLYPEARLLTAKENDFNDVNRQKFIGRCCTGDYDAVIMSYQQFQKIPMSVEYQQEFLAEQLKTLTEQLHDFNGYLSADDKRSVKDLERMKKNVETKLKKLLDTPHDNSLSFDQLGFDCVVTDEAHNYKNGLVVTKMKNVSGVGSRAAKKSEDFLMKTRYLNEKFGERNLILASGTPVSNSMTELYIMQQYLRPSALRRQGLQNFDDWASTFGEVVSQLELKPAGDGFRMKKRFAKFNNLPELMQAYKDFADIRTAEMLNLPVPEIEGGKPQVISAKPNEFQQAYMKVLAKRSEAIHNGSVDPSVDNMLKITNEARLLGLDARTINPDADNYPNSKVNLLIAKVMEIYTETTPQNGVQAIFCDIAINDGKKDTNEIDVEVDDGESEKTLSAEEQAEMLAASKFSVYKYIKEELIRRGIPESEICFAGDAKDQGQRGEMYAQLRAGTKRIVLASTTKMGTGANVQTRLCALHNLDIPWKPSDFEQRIGRIVRQGNKFPTVKIFNYVTEGTFDAYMLNLIVTKQKFISQLMSGKTPARTCEDVDELVLNYSEMQAIASGDPRIKEKIQLDTDVSRLRLLENEHLNKKYQLEDKVTFCIAQISIAKKQLALAQSDKDFASKNILPDGEFKIVINNKIFTERKEAGAELRKAQMCFLSKKQAMEIGEYRGFKISLNWGMASMGQCAVSVLLKQTSGNGLTYSYAAEMELQNDLGNITRLENVLRLGIDKRISQLKSDLARNEKDLAEAERTKDAPFEYAAELEEKSNRLTQLDAELGVGKKDEVIFDDDDSQEKGRGGKDNDTPKQKTKPKRPKH